MLAALAFERCDFGLERAALSRSFLGARPQARRVLAHLLDSGVQALSLEVLLGERLAQRDQPGLQFLVLKPCGLFFSLDFFQPLRCLGAFSLDRSHVLPKPSAFCLEREQPGSQDHFKAPAQLIVHLPIAPRLRGLPLERAYLLRNLRQDVGDARQVLP